MPKKQVHVKTTGGNDAQYWIVLYCVLCILQLCNIMQEMQNAYLHYMHRIALWHYNVWRMLPSQ